MRVVPGGLQIQLLGKPQDRAVRRKAAFPIQDPTEEAGDIPARSANWLREMFVAASLLEQVDEAFGGACFGIRCMAPVYPGVAGVSMLTNWQWTW